MRWEEIGDMKNQIKCDSKLNHKSSKRRYGYNSFDIEGSVESCRNCECSTCKLQGRIMHMNHGRFVNLHF